MYRLLVDGFEIWSGTSLLDLIRVITMNRLVSGQEVTIYRGSKLVDGGKWK